MARHPSHVAFEIQKAVPADLKGNFKETAQADLLWFAEDFGYKAPEQWGECFGRLTDYCWQHLFNQSQYLPEEWQMQVASILSTKPIEEIREINAEEHNIQKDTERP